MSTIKLSEGRLKSLIRECITDIINEREEIKSAFRSKHKPCSSVNEDVMAKYYGIKSNGCAPILLEKVTLNRIINKHGDNGLIGISANRSDLDNATNTANTRELLKQIQDSGFSYLPTYGGYRGTDGVEDDYEPSFIVFNYDSKGNPLDFGKLKELAIKWCAEFNQDSVLVKAPNENPIYLDRNGEKANSAETDKVYKNDAKQMFFTSFKDKDAVDTEIGEKLMGKYKSYCHKNNLPISKEGYKEFVSQHLTDFDTIGRRFTYDIQFECYVNPMPMTLNERRRRKNEIMIWE